MPKKIHDKVDDLLNSPSFYPEKSDKEREELAWPIATNIVKESSFNLKRFIYAQAEDLLKSNSIEDFVAKFAAYSAQNPTVLSKFVFANYIKANATFNNERLSKYPAFVALLNFFNAENRIVAKEQIQKFLSDKQKENPDNFNASLKTDEPEQQKTDSNEVDLSKQPQGITTDTVANNFPGQEKATGNFGTPGIQNFTQYTSQSAANAPKTKEQIDASERMFMMDNMNALRILSRNIFDVNALRNFEKDLTLSKNHIGTRFQGPVNNLLGKYGELASTPDSDRRTKNKLGAEIQYIIQNQLLGSGVRPSVVFNALQNPNQRTDYLYSGSKPPTPYQFRYVEDVYFDMKNELTNKFNEDRKAFAEDYVKKLKERYPNAQETPETLGEEVYPDELKLVAKPGSPIHQRAWMESNQKSVLQKAFGAEQADGSAPSNSSDTNPKGTMTFNSSTRNPGSQLNAPEAPDPRNIDKSNLSGMLGRPQITNPNPTKPSAFNYKDLKSSPPAPPAS
jgi:hypothetical protein